MSRFVDELQSAAVSSGVTLPPRVVSSCATHFELLLRWNKTHNLTRIVDPAEAARRHYLDCLVPLLALRERELVPSFFVDVGSGAGFPGLLAALVWPEAKAVLWEPAHKRLSFLMLSAAAMGLTVIAEAPPTTRSPSALPGALPAGVDGPGAAGRFGVGGVVLSRATFSEGKRGELLRAATDGIAVWGHPHDVPLWKTEVATWPAWRSGAQEYQVHGLEPRALLWGFRGEFHVKHVELGV